MFTVENEHCLYVLLLHCCDLPGENEHDLYCCCTAVTYESGTGKSVARMY